MTAFYQSVRIAALAMPVWLVLCLPALCLIVPSAAHGQNEGTTHITLFNTINDRLSLMEDVALYKKGQSAPVEDLAREDIVLGQSVEKASDLGLSSGSIRQFFNAQIAVAKAIQHRHLADWLSEPPNKEASDLQSQLRPALSALGDRIVSLIAELVRSGPELSEADRARFHAAIDVQHVSTNDKDLLFDSLLAIR